MQRLLRILLMLLLWGFVAGFVVFFHKRAESKENDLIKVNTSSETYEVNCLFVAVGMANGTSFARHLGLLTDKVGHLLVNDYMTNIPGIFAGGDTIGGVKQIVKAASDGCVAAYKIKDYIKGL